MGGHGLHADVRQPAAARREAGRPARAEGDVPDRPARLRGRLGHRRRLGQFRHAGDRAGLPGRVWRALGAVGAVAADDHVQRAEGARQGVRRLRGDRRGRRRGGPAARRHADRVPVLALDAVRQPDLRGRGLHRGSAPAEAVPGSGQAQAGHPGRAAGVRWPVLPGLRILERGHARLAAPRPRRASWSRAWCCSWVRVLAGPGGQPAAPAAGRAGPQPGRRVRVDAHRLERHVRHLPVPDLLHAADAGSTRRSSRASHSCRSPAASPSRRTCPPSC